jgi:hypothetical protein
LILFLGNRWILPLWTKTPHKQPPLDLTELEAEYGGETRRVYEAEVPEEYLELHHKRESEL